MKVSSSCIKLDFGCGEAGPREGYAGVDVRPLDRIEYVCNAWEINRHIDAETVEAIYSRHFLEHLSFPQAKQTLSIWFQLLKEGGEIELMVPDLRYHIDQFLSPLRTTEASAAKSDWTLEEHAVAGFYGWQRDAFTEIWDIHKSGYDFSLLRRILEKAGFRSVERQENDPWHLHIKARKETRSLNAGYYQDLHENNPAYRTNNWLIDKIDLIKGEVERVQNGKPAIVEIGCGNGIFLGKFTRATQRDVVGLDWAKSPILEKLIKADPHISFLQTDLNDLESFPQCELIVSSDLLEHIQPQDLSSLLKKADLASGKALHRVACYDDGHSHLTILNPQEWLGIFKSIDKDYQIVDVSPRYNDPSREVVTITKNIGSDQNWKLI